MESIRVLFSIGFLQLLQKVSLKMRFFCSESTNMYFSLVSGLLWSCKLNYKHKGNLESQTLSLLINRSMQIEGW